MGPASRAGYGRAAEAVSVVEAFRNPRRGHSAARHRTELVHRLRPDHRRGGVREGKQGDDDVKLIGVYSCEQFAQRAISKLLPAPGFKSFPDGFHVSRYPLDKDHWTEGFIWE